MDPHDPYGPPWTYGTSQEAVALRSIPLRRPRETEIEAFLASDPRLSAVDVRAHFLELYGHDIRYNDIQFGRLIDFLRDRRLLDSTLIVLVSDHGEEFLDHGHWAHGNSLYREQVGVPLVIRLPSSDISPRKINGLAQHVDILPTILDAIGASVPAGVHGRSLLGEIQGTGLVRDGGSVPGPVFSLLDLDGIEIESVAYSGFRLIRWNPESDAERVELFDLAADRAEMNDVAPQRPAMAGYLRSLLMALAHRPEPEFAVERRELDHETEERLRALGYID
jgi:arylsulfatase A-like enzyme